MTLRERIVIILGEMIAFLIGAAHGGLAAGFYWWSDHPSVPGGHLAVVGAFVAGVIGVLWLVFGSAYGRHLARGLLEKTDALSESLAAALGLTSTRTGDMPMTATIEEIAHDCAQEAWEIWWRLAPPAREIHVIVGQQPLDGDWEHLAAHLNREPTEDEITAFTVAFVTKHESLTRAAIDTYERGLEHQNPRFYGFEFASGRNTTSGPPDALRIAGTLHAFATEDAREEWVDAGVSFPTSNGLPPFRDAVSPAGLPMGWRRWDAVVHPEAE